MTATAVAAPNPALVDLPERAEIIFNALTVLLEPGSVAEIRIMDPYDHKGWTDSGYFNDFEKMASRAAQKSGHAPTVFFTLNPVKPALLARAVNRIEPRADKTTTDAEILRRRWFPVDIDPSRPSGISSTDAEHAAALAKAQEIKAALTAEGWPMPVAGDSGNGANLLYRIDLPNDEPSRLLVKSALEALAQRFNTPGVDLDTAVHNASRIWKVPGTIAGKGDNAPELGRPHRSSKLLEIPPDIQMVTREQLQALAALATKPQVKPAKKSAGKIQSSIDAGVWLAKYSIAVSSQSAYGEGGTRYVLARCPLNPAHEKSAAVIQLSEGGITANCKHNSCAELTWKKLREMHEPPEPAAPWRSQLLCSEGGASKPLLENALLVLRNSAEWAGVLAYDEFNHRAVTLKPAPWPQSRASADWTDFDDSHCCAWLQRNGVLVSSTRVAAEAAQTIALENSFHPVRDYLTALVWDQTSRVGSWLADYLGAEKNAYTSVVGGCWLISAVARIFQPGCKVDQILLLEGPQGAGKSMALRTLAGDKYFCDHISELGSKDSRVELAGTWIFELSELDRVRRAELSRVKAFFTAQTDVYRPPYGRRSERFPRNCIFCGTTNDSSSLTDESGNRRWWPIKIGTINIPALAQDRDQLWAEAVALYKAGEKWWLETPELNQIAAKEADLRYSPGPLDEQILDWCDGPRPREKRLDDHGEGSLPFISSTGKVTILDILIHAIGKSLDKITFADHAQVRRCLTHDGWRSLPQCRVKAYTGNHDNRARFYVKQNYHPFEGTI
jgi:hypothetical protein